MKCPECGTWTEVLDTRMRKDGSRRRRYQCANLHKFWTEERIVPGPSSSRTEKDAASSTDNQPSQNTKKPSL